MDFLGTSAAAQQVRQKAKSVATSNITVLLTGETGVGKERLARHIHHISLRAGKPFRVIDCPALPASLVEAELFGSERGSFTGSTNRKVGLVESADHGTILVDEVGDAGMETQLKLLRFLSRPQAGNQREIRNIGAAETHTVDVRILAATNQNLPEAVTAKSFRKDLYHRLAVYVIEIAPLRNRREDIEAIGTSFLRGIEIHPEVWKVLARHSWPGNVRELENVLEAAQAFAYLDGR